MKTRTGPLLLVAALVALAACSGPAAAPSQVRADPQAVTDRCADLIVEGLRGQTQSASKNQGVGHEVLVTFDSLVAHLPRHSGTTVRLAAIDYPALAEATESRYLQDVETGRRRLAASMASDGKACPESLFVMLGYSEGAQVAHETIAKLPAASTKAIAAVALLADPLRNPHDPIALETYGTGPLDGRGNAGYGNHFSSTIRDRVVSFCVRTDNVCNAPLGGRIGGISDAHRSFYEKASTAQVTGRRLADLITRH